MKRSKAPKRWRLPRKKHKWTINPHPGPHNKEAIPLAFVLRDYLTYAHTLREAKRILNERKVKINGRVRTDFKFPTGIMDVVEISSTGEFYRVLPNRKGNLILHPVTDEEKHLRPLKITGKYVVKGGKTQLRVHDGTTFLLETGIQKENEEDSEPGKKKKKMKKTDYSPLGTLVYDFESDSIADYFPFTKGNIAMVTAGRNVSRTGRIASIKGNMVEIEGEEIFRTLKENVLVIGRKESVISLPGG